MKIIGIRLIRYGAIMTTLAAFGNLSVCSKLERANFSGCVSAIKSASGAVRSAATGRDFPAKVTVVVAPGSIISIVDHNPGLLLAGSAFAKMSILAGVF